ncbi:hypothetical protein EDB86DRAFT_3242598 [Lactarius hatsudake]|nr:hypothetical protein EDB86DRAFT_3242598 [Lactarius hatsudake]
MVSIAPSTTQRDKPTRSGGALVCANGEFDGNAGTGTGKTVGQVGGVGDGVRAEDVLHECELPLLCQCDPPPGVGLRGLGPKGSPADGSEHNSTWAVVDAQYPYIVRPPHHDPTSEAAVRCGAGTGTPLPVREYAEQSKRKDGTQLCAGFRGSDAESWGPQHVPRSVVVCGTSDGTDLVERRYTRWGRSCWSCVSVVCSIVVLKIRRSGIRSRKSHVIRDRSRMYVRTNVLHAHHNAPRPSSHSHPAWGKQMRGGEMRNWMQSPRFRAHPIPSVHREEGESRLAEGLDGVVWIDPQQAIHAFQARRARKSCAFLTERMTRVGRARKTPSIRLSEPVDALVFESEPASRRKGGCSDNGMIMHAYATNLSDSPMLGEK